MKKILFASILMFAGLAQADFAPTRPISVMRCRQNIADAGYEVVLYKNVSPAFGIFQSAYTLQVFENRIYGQNIIANRGVNRQVSEAIGSPTTYVGNGVRFVVPLNPQPKAKLFLELKNGEQITEELDCLFTPYHTMKL